MEAEYAVRLKPIEPYLHLFPKARVVDQTVKKGADVSHTVNFIPQVVRQCRWQVEAFVKSELKGLTTYKALEKLWHWVKYHIAYERDEFRKEQVRSPRRLVHDRKGDCDCFTTFIDCCTSWLPGVAMVENAITKYGGKDWQHIYPIVTIERGRRVIMDCVANAFDYEVPFTEQLTVPLMELQFLDGFGDNDYFNSDLGKINIFKKGGLKQVVQNVKQEVKQTVQNVQQKVQTAAQKTGAALKTAAQKTATVAKQAVHVVNKVNPATALLRAGVLAAMKTNMMNVAGRLKWAYMSDAAAQAKGADMAKLTKLRSVVKKLEDIFHGAGGEPKNLKEAILTGKGNKDKSVAGLEYVNVDMPLSQLLGPQIYYSEELNGLDGTLGQLGEPVTATAIAAASGAIATIAALIKQIGNLFPKNAAGAKDFDAGDNESGEPGMAPAGPTILEQANASATGSNIMTMDPVTQQALQTVMQARAGATPSAQMPAATVQMLDEGSNDSGQGYSFTQPTEIPGSQIQNSNLRLTAQSGDPIVVTSANTNTPPNNTTPETIWQKHKWLKPTLFAAGGLTVATLGFVAIRAATRRKPALSGLRKKSSDPSGLEVEFELEGLKKPCKCHEKAHQHTPKKRGRKKRAKHEQLSAIALM